jgi:hypothetical protein
MIARWHRALGSVAGLGVAVLLVAGCSSQDASGPLCEARPEPIQPQAILPNTLSLNTLSLNGTQVNTLSLNGLTLNGTQVNGTQVNSLSLNGSELTGVAADGRKLAGADFVGATLTGVLSDGSTIALVVAGYSVKNGVSFYALERAGEPVCANGAPGLFVAGAWDSTAARHDTLTVGAHTVDTTYSCTDGAIGKCVVWGYDPSVVGADLHQSCTRMVRADYCGNGVSFTKNGTLIDVFDTRGVEQPTAGDPSLLFEAAWTTTGAACVARTRYDARLPSGAAVLPSCWSALPKCTSWTDAQTHGAVLGNASRLASRSICQ